MFFNVNIYAEFASGFFQIFRSHIGVSNTRRTGRYADDSWRVGKRGRRLRASLVIQRREQLIRRRRRLYTRPNLIIRKARGQRCQQLHMRSTRFIGGNRQQHH
ncbi:Uncharacterised protein [Shigella sonnei]|nr:Uncharacterised protein [Shigella sonnei]CSS10844.1 Uncharacterised protein [Shigella sonnei]